MFPFIQSLQTTMVWADMAGRARLWADARKVGVVVPTAVEIERFADNEGLSLPEVTPDEAVRYWLERQPVLKADPVINYTVDLYEKRAWSVARVFRQNLVEQIKGHVESILKEGITQREFATQVNDFLKQMAADTLTPAHLETVYRTNVQTAYNAGLWREMDNPLMQEEFPFFEYFNPEDARSRPTHAAMSGVWADRFHPVWNIWWPPNGYNCRCQVRSIGKKEAQRRGMFDREPSIPDVKPDAGFSGNTGAEIYRGV
uniref:Putative capsid morphogenesis protein n=1 Tax=viral metagenome TaxID=1070528 RepID=A0A6H1ZPH5_9ZZZZ